MKNTTDQRLGAEYGPKRIVCLTEETTETLYLLGEESRIVGVSGFTVRPKRARKEKPKISTFVEANIDDILALGPDLVIGFSDIQATIAKELIERGITVWINNHRSVQGILEMMVQLGALVDKREQALHLVKKIEADIRQIKQSTSHWHKKPKVYFEEWYDPLITGIEWVSELIELAGGIDVFPENRKASLAKDRIIEDENELVQRNPDIILASWCGKMFKKQKMLQRPNWQNITAVKTDAVFEIKSEIILQPGPAALMEGLPLLHQVFSNWIAKHG